MIKRICTYSIGYTVQDKLISTAHHYANIGFQIVDAKSYKKHTENMRFTYQKAVQFNSIYTHVIDLHKEALSQYHQNFASFGLKLTRLGVSDLTGKLW